jgi:hypothetical protein
VRDEAVAECRAVQTLAWAAQRLGASAAEGRRLAALYVATGHERLPAHYRSPDCRDGGRLDLRPGDATWP